MTIIEGETTYRVAFREGLRPGVKLSVSEWADRHRILSSKSSAEQGPWRTSRTPYLREIMDALADEHPARAVTFKKGAQVGGTEAGNNWIGYSIDHQPAPMMMVQPSLDLAKRMSKQRLEPLIEDSPRLAAKVAPRRSRESGSTLLQKDFPNGTLVLTGANSSAGLRSMPVRKLFMDEVDAYPGDVEGEGDPMKLAQARTRTFKSRKKIFTVSTPTIQGRSRIELEYGRSDQSYYHVPCPECGLKQKLKWKGIHWEKRATPEETVDAIELGEARVWYVCEECEAEIPEHKKTAMLAGGVWIATKPERSTIHRGFHLSALYSPVGWYSWTEAVCEYIQALDRPDELRVWVNTTLGEEWNQKGEAPEWEILYQRRESYGVGSPPDGVLFLTAGVDVQKDRLELEVVGWGKGKESWSVDYVVLQGEPEGPEVWEQLRQQLGRTFLLPNGAELQIRTMAIDSGYSTQNVYRFVRTQPSSRVLAVKGRDNSHLLVGIPKPADVTVRGRKLKRGLRIWPIDVGVAKEELFGWLNLKQPNHPGRDGYPPGWCHFPQYGEEFFKMLTAEQIVSRIVRGYRRYLWEKTRERNEALDCRVYARAAASVLGMDRWGEADWRRLQEGLGSVSPSRPTQSKATPRRKRSRWMDKGR